MKLSKKGLFCVVPSIILAGLIGVSVISSRNSEKQRAEYQSITNKINFYAHSLEEYVEKSKELSQKRYPVEIIRSVLMEEQGLTNVMSSLKPGIYPVRLDYKNSGSR